MRHAKDVLALRGLGAEVQGLRVVDRLGSSPLGLGGLGIERQVGRDEIPVRWASIIHEPGRAGLGWAGLGECVRIPIHRHPAAPLSSHRPHIHERRVHPFGTIQSNDDAPCLDTTTEAAACARGCVQMD